MAGFRPGHPETPDARISGGACVLWGITRPAHGGNRPYSLPNVPL
jgi:hypothetical protein